MAGEVLTASDLNAEFDNIINNAITLVSPWVANTDAGGFRLINLALGSVSSPTLQFTGDTNTGVYSPASETVGLAGAGVDVLRTVGAVGGVNYHDFRSQSTGNAPEHRAAGSDTNISIRLVPQGTGFVQIATAGGYVAGGNTVPGLAFADFDSGIVQTVSGTLTLVGNNRPMLDLQSSPSATNYFKLVSAATGATPYLAATGADSQVDFELRASSGFIKAATAFIATGFMGGGQPAINALYAQNVPKAWVGINSSIVLEDSFNVSSITDEAAAGNFTVNFHRAFSGATYIPLGLTQALSTTGNCVGMNQTKNRQADSCSLMIFRTDAFGGQDASAFVVFFGRQ